MGCRHLQRGCYSGQRGSECSRRSGELFEPLVYSRVHWTGLDPAIRKENLCRNTISENVEGKQADLFEEIGIDLDETVGVEYKQLELLMPRKRRR